MSALKNRAPLAPLALSQGERHAESKRRRDKFDYMKVLAGAETAYSADGWTVSKPLKKQVRLQKPKLIDRLFEDRVWRLFYRMDYDELNKGHNFTIQYRAADKTVREKQVDLFAKDEETVIVGECKACDDYRSRNLSKDLAEFIGLRKQLADAIRAHYGRDFKPKILWFFFTDKVIWSAADKAKANAEHVHVMTEREVDYFSQLSEHLGRATRYQFLAEYLGGQKIPEMKDVKVPAIRGSLGGKTFYSFVSTAEQLLKICFVNHRTLADPLALPTYQRLVKKARLKAIGNFIRGGGFFPTNILINFDERRRFDKRGNQEDGEVEFGDLHLPEKYKSAWVVDGQHRLYGYSVIEPEFSKQNIAVIAFEALKREEEANLFVTINHEQKTVQRTLLDELDADLKWGSSIPAERLASIAARIVQTLTEMPNGPLFRRVVAQGMKGNDVTCLTMPEIKGGIIRSHLIGSLAHKRKSLYPGPLSADNDHNTVRRAAHTLNLYFEHIQSASKGRWDAGRSGELCTNVGVRALLLLLDALIKHAASTRRKFDPKNADPKEIIEEVRELALPLTTYFDSVSDSDFRQKFAEKYGSGGPPEYFYELCHIIAHRDKDFRPPGLEEYLSSKDDRRVKEAEDTIKYIEVRTTEIIVSYFKKLHGDKYWSYMCTTKDMRVKAYDRQQQQPLENQLDLEAYLDLVDKKKIIETTENWKVFKEYFDIPRPEEKGVAKNIKWLDRLNELRKVAAHPSPKRIFKSNDLEFLEWIRSAFEKKLLASETGGLAA